MDSFIPVDLLYRGFYVLGFLFIFVFNTFYGKKYNIKPIKALIFSVVSYALVFGWSYILAWIANGFEWGHHNAIRVYMWFPLILMLMSKVFSVKWKVACEYLAPSACFVYGIARIGCLFPGCCYGYEAEWGIYSLEAERYCVPVQLFEAITALIIGGIVLFLAARKKYKVQNGSLYPIMMVMYGGTRFLWEFFADNEKIIWGISELAIWAMGTLVVGIIWLLIINQKSLKVKQAK